MARRTLLWLLLMTSPLLALEGEFQVFLVEKDTPVREKPGFLFKETGQLRAGDEVLVDAEEGEWLHVAHGGWVPADALRAKVFGRSYEVVTEGARIRSGPGTTHEIVGKKAEGDRIRVVETSGEWLRLEEGGWIFAALVRPLGGRPAEAPPAEAPQPSGPPRPARSMQVKVASEAATLREGPADSQPVVGKAARDEVLEVVEFRDGWLRTKDGAWLHHEQVVPLTASGKPVAEREYRQWGLLSLTGVYLKLVEVPPESVVAQRVQESLNRLTGKKRGYTFFTIVVDVPPVASFRFNFSPEHNRVLIVDTAGREFGNFVHTQGVLEELPPEVRVLFDAQEVFPGNVGTGILAFSGELRASQVDRVFVYVSGRMQELYEEG